MVDKYFIDNFLTLVGFFISKGKHSFASFIVNFYVAERN